MIHDLHSRHNGERNISDVTSLDKLKSCCHNNLRDLCVQTDGAWWKLKMHCHQKDIGNYPDGCIICLKSFSTGCVSPEKKGNYCMVGSICYDLLSSHNFEILNNSLIYCLFFSKHMEGVVTIQMDVLFVWNFFVECVLPAKRSTHITKINGEERENERNEFIVFQCELFQPFWSMLINSICANLLYITLLFLHRLIDSCKQRSCF